MKRLVFMTAACALATVAEADVRLAPVFGDRMVLQREMPVRVWGFADPRETVTVRFADQKKTVVADDDGTWKLYLAEGGKALRFGPLVGTRILVK